MKGYLTLNVIHIKQCIVNSCFRERYHHQGITAGGSEKKLESLL